MSAQSRLAFVTILAASLISSCNEHPVRPITSELYAGGTIPISVDPSGKLDLLWVIDNSGSMCQEQAVLRDNFGRFIEELDGAVVDFHIAVTTTHMDGSYPLEPVARPGYLQSTPQPLPGFDASCYVANDEDGRPIDGDFTPIRDLIATAVDCMVTPDPNLTLVSDDDIRCALGCRTIGACEPDECAGVSLFPDPSSYREIPLVLRASDYRNDDGRLDLDRLQSDFACMSMVGMRGFGIEKGLGALVRAVDPEMTGGTESNPSDASAPNHGFVRDDARFAAVFVTDENDCTHDGTLSERTACGDDLCDFWNRSDLPASPLIAPQKLREELLANLRRTKGVDALAQRDVLVASIHGISRRYEGPVSATMQCLVDAPDQLPSCDAFQKCESADYVENPPTCSTQLGAAYSGDRYEQFLRSFGDGNYYPQANGDDPLTGWMCAGDFRPALSSIAEFIRDAPQGCIVRPIQSCEPASECPAHETGEPGSCVPRGDSDTFICDSYVQVRVRTDSARHGDLRNAGFCSQLGQEGDCLVPPSAYTLQACGGAADGVKVAWADPAAARQALAGTELLLGWVGVGAR